jgi:hypothetical protein
MLYSPIKSIFILPIIVDPGDPFRLNPRCTGLALFKRAWQALVQMVKYGGFAHSGGKGLRCAGGNAIIRGARLFLETHPDPT